MHALSSDADYRSAGSDCMGLVWMLAASSLSVYCGRLAVFGPTVAASACHLGLLVCVWFVLPAAAGCRHCSRRAWTDKGVLQTETETLPAPALLDQRRK